MTMEQYADQWEKSAAAFLSGGHYAWMNQQLEDAQKIIEIGCGSGASTGALAASGRKILSVDCNPAFIKSAHEHLQGKSLTTEVISLQQCNELTTWSGPQIKLLEADIFAETLIENIPFRSFDAIVCWLIGSYPEHIFELLHKENIDADKNFRAKYRESVHQIVYKLGKKALVLSGIVHIVDRSVIPTWHDKDLARNEVVQDHEQLASSDYEVTRDNCFLRKLSDELSQSRINYVADGSFDDHRLPVLCSSKASLRPSGGYCM